MKNCDPLVSFPALAMERSPKARTRRINCISFNNFLITFLENKMDTWSSVLDLEVLISKFKAIDRLSTSSITEGEVPALDHKAGDDSVEWASLVMKWLSTFPHAFLACTMIFKLHIYNKFFGLLCYVPVQTHNLTGFKLKSNCTRRNKLQLAPLPLHETKNILPSLIQG